MTGVAIAAIVVLGAFCVVLYLSQDKRQARHDEAMERLVQQVTSTNPSRTTLKAMKQTAEVLTHAVDKVTGTIGSSYATATGVGQGTTVQPVEPPPDDEYYIPDVDQDGYFVDPLLPPSLNGMISPSPQEPTLPQ